MDGFGFGMTYFCTSCGGHELSGIKSLTYPLKLHIPSFRPLKRVTAMVEVTCTWLNQQGWGPKTYIQIDDIQTASVGYLARCMSDKLSGRLLPPDRQQSLRQRHPRAFIGEDDETARSIKTTFDVPDDELDVDIASATLGGVEEPHTPLIRLIDRDDEYLHCLALKNGGCGELVEDEHDYWLPFNRPHWFKYGIAPLTLHPPTQPRVITLPIEPIDAPTVDFTPAHPPLPTPVATRILSLLPFHHRMGLASVSRTFRSLTRHPALWTNIHVRQYYRVCVDGPRDMHGDEISSTEDGRALKMGPNSPTLAQLGVKPGGRSHIGVTPNVTPTLARGHGK